MRRNIYGLVLFTQKEQRKNNNARRKNIFHARQRPFGGAKSVPRDFRLLRKVVQRKLKKPPSGNYLRVVGAPGLEPGIR